MRYLFLVVTLSLTLTTNADSRFAYSYQRSSDDGVSMMRGSLDEWLRIKGTLGRGPYLWARVDGRGYIVRDPQFLREIDREFEPERAIERELRQLYDQIEVYEGRVERLEDKIDDISDLDERLTSADEARLRELRAELREAEQALRPLEQRERELERREEEIDKRMDAAIERIARKAVRDGIAKPFPD